MPDVSADRDRMVETQIAGRGVSDPSVLEAMRSVPREEFVPEELREFAYDDTPLAIGEGQTISQPFIVAHMIEAAGVKAGDKVLEVGAGSGYAAAVISRIAGHVTAVERHARLAAEARRRLARLGYHNIDLHVGDGSGGWSANAPYDVIIVSAGAPDVPDSLKAQLRPGGRLVIPVGLDERRQTLRKVVRRGEAFDEEDLGAVMFVPLIGEQGWAEHSASASVPKKG